MFDSQKVSRKKIFKKLFYQILISWKKNILIKNLYIFKLFNLYIKDKINK